MAKIMVVLTENPQNLNNDQLIEIAKAQNIKIIFLNYTVFAAQETNLKLTGADHFSEHELIILQQLTYCANTAIFILLQAVALLKQHQPLSLTVILPYLYYSRQTNSTNVQSNGLDLLLSMLEFLQIDRLITIDIHQTIDLQLYNFKLINIIPTQLWVPHILEHYFDHVIIAPDHGSVARAQAVAKMLNSQLIILTKTRKADHVTYAPLTYQLVASKYYIIIDDIVDSGQTIVKAAELLRTHGAHHIISYCTHTFLSQVAVDLISNSVIENLYVTNSIPNNYCSNKIKLLNIYHLITPDIF